MLFGARSQAPVKLMPTDSPTARSLGLGTRGGQVRLYRYNPRFGGAELPAYALTEWQPKQP